MTSDQLARDYLNRARMRRVAVEALMGAGGYADVVRESQEIVELVLKGTLRFVGVDPPKRHDVHVVLTQFIERLPAAWQEALVELRGPLDRLAAERSPAFYGDEQADIPASELFGETDARRAMAIADRLLELYTRLLGEND
jgi:HEPN domain-containing protein